ncbi:hypothetical protein ACFU90_22400 [Streptomyces noursei]|uniref:hypothetical protein n=1 Tax=Streptomyces noursei TaxID=1971 RepID=UPI0035DA2F21
MGERRALLIATERYLDDSLPQLRSPVHDARKLAALLEDPDIGQFDAVQVLVDESKAVIELFSGDAAEGPLVGTHRPVQLPPGRARFIGRRREPRLVQTAWLPQG